MRRGAVIVGQSRTDLTQAAAPCQFSVSPSFFTFDSTGGDGTVTVSTLEGCQWTTAVNAPWMSIAATQNTNGPGSVTFRITANAGEPRTSIFTVASQPVQVSQGAAAAPCMYSLDPGSATVDATGGSARFSVAARDGCGWTAVSQVPWISVAGNAVGTGNGSVALIVSPNTGAERSGIVTLQNQTFTVTQAGAAAPCAYTIAPTSLSLAGGGGPASVSVTAQSGCTWTAASQASWLVVSSGSTGNGNGTVGLVVAANTGAARSGTALIAGRTLTVNQAAAPAPACTYAISPSSFAAPASAATSAVEVTTQSGCTWTAVSQVQWITVTAGSAGTGSGRVDVAIAANTGAARSGTVTIAGHTYTVTQAAVAAPCSYTIAPTSFNAPDAETNTAVDVTTQSECAWTAASNDAWITITRNASGTGNGRVELRVAANPGAARTGTVTIAGRTYTVNQAAAPTPCSYTIAPTSFAAPDTASMSTVDVTTTMGCAWTAISQVPWITVTAGASGNGNGRVDLAIAANTGAARSGTVLIAGRTYTVNQAAPPAPCSYAIAPTSFNAPDTASTSAVDVTTQNGCAWTAVSQTPWITVTTGASGSGNGRVELAIAANTDGARSGTVTIGGQTYTVNQAAAPTPCTYTLTPTSVTATAAGGATGVDVATQTGCAWTAVSQAQWITVTMGASGSGNGRVELAIAVNTGAARVGTVTIGGLTFTVNQEGTGALAAPL